MLRSIQRTFEYSHGGRIVVDSPCCSECRGDDRGRGDEIVGEGVVEVALEFEDVLYLVKLFLVSVLFFVLAFAFIDLVFRQRLSIGSALFAQSVHASLHQPLDLSNTCDGLVVPRSKLLKALLVMCIVQSPTAVREGSHRLEGSGRPDGMRSTQGM